MYVSDWLITDKIWIMDCFAECRRLLRRIQLAPKPWLSISIPALFQPQLQKRIDKGSRSSTSRSGSLLHFPNLTSLQLEQEDNSFPFPRLLKLNWKLILDQRHEF